MLHAEYKTNGFFEWYGGEEKFTKPVIPLNPFSFLLF
jgi:hypothetical protein